MAARRRRKREKKSIPALVTEAREREFWETHDSTDYVDWSLGRRAVFPNLKPSTTTISLRLPAPLLADLKALANKRDVPYQSLLKVFLAERVAAEHHANAVPASTRPERTRGKTARHSRVRLATGRSAAGR